MRRILFGLLLLTLVSGSYLAYTLQNEQQTSPVRRVYTYIALGDSYTIGESVKATERWPNQLIERLKEEDMDVRLVANPSVTGFTTSDLLKTAIDEVKRYQPDLITVQIGVNDLHQGRTSDEFSAQLQTLINEIQVASPKSRILVVTIPNYAITPYGNRTVDRKTTTTSLHEYNTVIRQAATANGLRVVDVYPISLLVEEDTSLISYDGLHPSGKQYGLWVDSIAPATQILLDQ